MAFGLFGKGKPKGEEKSKAGEAKLPGPKGMPELLGSRLVTDFKVDPGWAWNDANKVMIKDAEVDGKPITYFRIPDWKTADNKKIDIKNYHSLDAHPELILIEGRLDKKSKTVHVDKMADVPKMKP